jgi:hypothetical protein
MLYRPRHGPADVPPLLRRWCDTQGLPAPSGVSTPRLTYLPFWRFASHGHPRLTPAWPALEACWAEVPLPDAEQVVYDPSIGGSARVVEATVAEAAARNRAFGEIAAREAAGELVHVPFYEVQATIGTGRLAAWVEACSGRVYPVRVPPVTGRAARGAAVVATALGGFVVMFLEAMLIPPAWLAGPSVTLTAWLFYRAVIGNTGSATS